MKFELNENQLKNLLTFLNRVECKGIEAMALSELFNIFSKNIDNNLINKKEG